MQFDFWSLIVFLAAGNALLIGIVLFVKNIVHRRINWLALALVSLSFCQFQFLVAYLSVFESFPHLIYLEAPVWYLVGPFILLHLKEKSGRFDLLHALPAIAMFFYVLPFYLLAARDKIAYFIQQSDPGTYQANFLHYLYLFHLGLYLICGTIVVLKHERRLKNFFSHSGISAFANIKLLLMALGVYTLTAFTISLLMDYNYSYWAPFDFINFFILSAFMIILALSPVWFGEAPLPRRGRYYATPFENDQLEQLLTDLQQLLENEKLYLNPNLKINDLAEKLDISMPMLSAAINKIDGRNFFDFINSYRVEAVKENLGNPDYHHFTLMAIASEFGFNSNTSFYRIFKKHTGVTPRVYLRNLIDKDAS